MGLSNTVQKIVISTIAFSPVADVRRCILLTAIRPQLRVIAVQDAGMIRMNGVSKLGQSGRQ